MHILWIRADARAMYGMRLADGRGSIPKGDKSAILRAIAQTTLRRTQQRFAALRVGEALKWQRTVALARPWSEDRRTD
jgi:hypothetical protein